MAVATAVLCTSALAAAESTYEEVWTCRLKENKSIKDVQAINSQWLKWINGNVQGGNIKSSVVTPVVGDSDVFLFVDSFADLATWSAAKTALETDEGKAVEAMFEDVSECSENRLYKMTPTQ